MRNPILFVGVHTLYAMQIMAMFVYINEQIYFTYVKLCAVPLQIIPGYTNHVIAMIEYLCLLIYSLESNFHLRKYKQLSVTSGFVSSKIRRKYQ